jgi:two-component system, NtrC family, C4-dicarboxylate transport sensor histidine kinase DctB
MRNVWKFAQILPTRADFRLWLRIMASSQYRAHRSKWLVLAGVALSLLIAAIMFADRIAERRAIDTEQERLTAIARLSASAYLRQVDKFRLVATTLSADPDVALLLDQRTAQSSVRLNRRLAGLSATLDASVIYVLDDSGTTIASSNSQQPDSFVNQNYGFRAYFIKAMESGQWEQYALGTRSLIPGLFVARRVTTSAGKRGVIVVKIRFDRLEREWSTATGIAFVTSNQGVILISSKPQWRFETIGKLDAVARQRLTQQVEYGGAPLRQNALYANGTVIRSGANYRSGIRYVEAADPLPDGGAIHILAPVDDAVANARWFARLAVALAFVAIAALIAAFALRARAIVAREHRENEERLSELKDRLVQANKLSTLGQVAAGVGHEVNQPLTAIGIRAQAARKLIAKGRIEEAGAVCDEIGALVARAGAITGELRRFSRRTSGKVTHVSLADVFSGTQLLMGDRLRSTGTDLIIQAPSISVKGDQGRLEQVFVNLIQNALDAMGDGGKISILVDRTDDNATIQITDNGPGISDAVRERLFQPFTSSKDDGLGLGLVICRDIITDMGGDLSHRPDIDGACFQIILKVAS